MDRLRSAGGPSTEALVQPWVDADERGPNMRRKMPISFHRKMVVLSANEDLAIAANLGAPVSMDRYHAEMASARVQRGDASPVFGQRALDILLPDNLERLDWADIDALRYHPGITEYRRVLAEIEEVAASGCHSRATVFAVKS